MGIKHKKCPEGMMPSTTGKGCVEGVLNKGNRNAISNQHKSHGGHDLMIPFCAALLMYGWPMTDECLMWGTPKKKRQGGSFTSRKMAAGGGARKVRGPAMDPGPCGSVPPLPGWTLCPDGSCIQGGQWECTGSNKTIRTRKTNSMMRRGGRTKPVPKYPHGGIHGISSSPYQKKPVSLNSCPGGRWSNHNYPNGPICESACRAAGCPTWNNVPYGNVGTGSWTPDGMCDPACNIPECGYDQGDCCESTCMNGLYNECGSAGYQCIDPNAIENGGGGRGRGRARNQAVSNRRRSKSKSSGNFTSSQIQSLKSQAKPVGPGDQVMYPWCLAVFEHDGYWPVECNGWGTPKKKRGGSFRKRNRRGGRR